MEYKLVSLVLPMYRQADQVANIVDATSSALEKLPIEFEILLAPNGPADGTVDACAQEAARSRGVRVINAPLGWGAAVRAGIDFAAGDLICFTNSARTSPEDLLLILMYANAYPGVVVKATRRTRDNRRRRMGSLLYNLECRTLFDLPYFDVNGTPKAFPRSCSSLLSLTHGDDLLDVEFLRACRQQDYPLVEVPILSTERVGGMSTTNYRSAWKLYAGALNLWAQDRQHYRGQSST